jgi:hypothetical protein
VLQVDCAVTVSAVRLPDDPGCGGPPYESVVARRVRGCSVGARMFPALDGFTTSALDFDLKRPRSGTLPYVSIG